MRRRMHRGAGRMAMLAACMCLSAGVAMARDPDPVLRIPLEPMGYQTMLAGMLAEGSSMMTVDFADKNHLLVTFGVRRLMKRDPNDPPQDDDHTIAAFLLEMPSGKIIARTEWRAHDRGQYLWNLGHGRFLLRVHDQLTVFAPMAAATSDDAFREYPFLRVERRIVAILLSAGDDLLTVETMDPAEAAKPKYSGPVYGGADGPGNPAPVQINFYRLNQEMPGENKILLSDAGAIRARAALALPVTTVGLLEVLEGGSDRWLFNFDSHAGKVTELAEFDTTCFPRPMFVSRSEFVAFGCRGSMDRQNIAAFNLKGEEMWQQNFFDTQIAPEFEFAPEAGRFALERTIVGGRTDAMGQIYTDDVTGQEVRVYQSSSGKMLFRMLCSPVVRAGQNFALSEDGMRVAMLRETMIDHKATNDFDAYTSGSAEVDVYGLPELSGKEKAAVKEAQGLAPEDTGVRIDLALQKIGSQAAANGAAETARNAASAVRTVPAAASSPRTVDQSALPSAPDASDAGNVSGDAPPETPRRPPTLYGPDEGHDKAPGDSTPR